MYALIIAGGEGERLRPLTNDRPKNMVPVAGRPIVERQLEWLRSGGVTDAIFLCGYKHEVLEAHIGDGSRFGVRAQYSLEADPLGRGGALKQGFACVPETERRVIACNGDILTDQSLAELIASHEARQAIATIMLTPLKSPYGVVDVEDDGRITSFREKPVLPYWINAGIYVLSRQIATLLPDKGDHETETFPGLAAQGKLAGFRSQAYWRPVDSIKDLSEAERELATAG
jgi:NDP-sugar pyrophosphorylase family protein